MVSCNPYLGRNLVFKRNNQSFITVQTVSSWDDIWYYFSFLSLKDRRLITVWFNGDVPDFFQCKHVTNPLPCWSITKSTMSLHYLNSRTSPSVCIIVWVCGCECLSFDMTILLSAYISTVTNLNWQLMSTVSKHIYLYIYILKCHAFISATFTAFIYSIYIHPCICVSRAKGSAHLQIQSSEDI